MDAKKLADVLHKAATYHYARCDHATYYGPHCELLAKAVLEAIEAEAGSR